MFDMSLSLYIYIEREREREREIYGRILGVLLDRVAHALRADLVLLPRRLGDLADEVALEGDGLTLLGHREERDVVPEGDVLGRYGHSRSRDFPYTVRP